MTISELEKTISTLNNEVLKAQFKSVVNTFYEREQLLTEILSAVKSTHRHMVFNNNKTETAECIISNLKHTSLAIEKHFLKDGNNDKVQAIGHDIPTRQMQAVQKCSETDPHSDAEGVFS